MKLLYSLLLISLCITYTYSNEIILNHFLKLKESMVKYNDKECETIFNGIVNESDRFIDSLKVYSKSNNTGDTNNQLDYMQIVVKGRIEALKDEAKFILNKCSTKQMYSPSMFDNFMKGWDSSIDTFEYIYNNNIFNRKTYTVTDNIIKHSDKELNRYFYHFKDCSDIYCPEMVVIPPGTFYMGGTDKKDSPRHKVTIEKPFAMGIHEVTIQQFLEFTKVSDHVIPKGATTFDSDIDTPFYNNINYNNPHGNGKLNIYEPVTCLRKEDTRLFVRWLSSKTNQTYRLPTESEWEYVARSNYNQFINYNETACHYDNVYDKSSVKSINDINKTFKCNDHSSSISSVASYLPNGFGIYDMMGNVKEYVSDCWHPNFDGAPSNAKSWDQSNDGLCAYPTYKGGSWSSGPNHIKISMRSTIYSSQTKSNTIGFRLVRDI